VKIIQTEEHVQAEEDKVQEKVEEQPLTNGETEQKEDETQTAVENVKSKDDPEIVEQPTKTISEQLVDAVSEQPTETASEQSTESAPEQSTETVKEQPTETTSEQP